MAGVGEYRSGEPSKPVLLRAQGIWTGRLCAWELRPDGWHGHVRWPTVAGRREAVLPARDLRPFERQWVEVRDVFGDWQVGDLIGWRRRPGYSWEGEVIVWHSPDRSDPPVWFSVADLRPRHEPPSAIVDRDVF